MAIESAPARRFRFLRRPRVTDVLIVGFVALLAVAVVVNGVADVHDVRRTRLDRKVAKSWFASHPQLGRFGPPTVRIHQRRDIACAARRPSKGVANPTDGLCIAIADTSPTSKTILHTFRCIYLRAGQTRKGHTVCPPHHGDSVTG
jgi:hypothetical protein